MSVAKKSQKIKSDFLSYYQKNETRFAVGFFLAGFLFDILTLSEINDPFSIGQQILYLGLIGSFLYYDFLNRFEKVQIHAWLKKIWEYRQIIVHFTFGSLLSIYSIFYFKSSSILSSFIFIIIMSLILIANEISRVQQAGLWVKFALWGLCLNAFFSMMYPTALGFIGYIPFGLSVLSTLGIFYFLFRKFTHHQIELSLLKKLFLYPTTAVQIFFILFYFIGWIPPVPLSAKFMGIYHHIEKKDGQYFLSHQNPKWKFWNSGDQNFYMRPGDKIYFFANIYSPARFNDQVFVRWVYKDEVNGWVTWDKIPITISGGREDGFRGYTSKSNYKAGDWRVQLETSDEREIGRIYLTVYEDQNLDERVFNIEFR